MARRGRTLYPDRLSPYSGEMRALAALGHIDEINALFTRALTLPMDVEWTAAQVAAATIFELRWHGHAAAADTLSARLIAWLPTRSAQGAASAHGRSDRADALIAAHRWDDLQSLSDSLLKEQRTDLLALRLQGIALGMRGHRHEARQIASGIEHSGRRFYYGEDRRARAYIAAAVGDKETAVALFDPRMAQFDEQHQALISELLRDYPPFQERLKSRP